MSLLDFIFPKSCFECGKSGEYICSNCLSKVQIVKSFCPECKRPSIDGFTHIKCKKPHGLDGLTSIWRYEGIVRKAVIELKYKFVEDCAKQFAEVTKGQMPLVLQKNNFTLVPVPLHASRVRWRGFNQSESVGKLIASELNWGFEDDLLTRKVATKSQTELKKEERGENIKGAFEINKSKSLLDESYVIFDDVWTTGATIKEACKVLKRNSAKEVWGLTICS